MSDSDDDASFWDVLLFLLCLIGLLGALAPRRRPEDEF